MKLKEIMKDIETNKIELDPETEIELVRVASRESGTARKDKIYRVSGTDTAVVVHEANGGIKNLWRNDIEIDETYFQRSRDYARRCAIAARRHHLPMEVILAIGPEYAADFAYAAGRVKHMHGRIVETTKQGYQTGEWHIYMVCADPRRPLPRPVDEMPQSQGIESELYWELSCGIDRKKKALLSLLWGASDDLRAKVENMGQKNTQRLADYFKRY